MKGIVIIICFNLSISFSQQEPQFSMFWKNYSLFNPANAGIDNTRYANLIYRNNWVKIENSPNVVTALYETKLNKYNSGVGVGFLRNFVGLHTSTRFYTNYNYQIKFNESKLSLGLGVDYDIMQYNNQWLPPSGVPDPNLPTNIKQGKVNLNFGAVFKMKRLKLGISLTQVNQVFYDKILFKKAKHIFIFAQYRISAAKKIEIIPAFYIKSDFVANTLDLNTRFVYDKKYWIGLSFRNRHALVFQAGFTLFNSFNLAYNYDYNMSNLSIYPGGSHEFSVGFKID